MRNLLPLGWIQWRSRLSIYCSEFLCRSVNYNVPSRPLDLFGALVASCIPACFMCAMSSHRRRLTHPFYHPLHLRWQQVTLYLIPHVVHSALPGPAIIEHPTPVHVNTILATLRWTTADASVTDTPAQHRIICMRSEFQPQHLLDAASQQALQTPDLGPTQSLRPTCCTLDSTK